jgi:phosphatidylglycerophosphatase A
MEAAAGPPTLLDRASILLATWFGSGYAPVASGTVATAAAIPLQLALALLLPGPWRLPGQIAAIVLLSLAGIYAAGVLERRLGRHDPSEAVIDEVAGYLVTMFLVPPTILTVACGFLLFRIFDIVKPWPAGPAERLGGGLGIMADDLMCGVYACLLLHLGMKLLGGSWL